MAKRPQKSIADLLGKKAKPSLEKVDQIADQIHAKKEVSTPQSTPLTNRTKRISLNTPIDLYLEIQREATMQGTSLMHYILETVKADIDSKK